MLQEYGKLGTRTRRGIGINVIVMQGDNETIFVGFKDLAFILKEFYGDCTLRHVWDRQLGEER